VIRFVSDLHFCTTGRWFSPVSSSNKTDRHDITEILLKVTLNTISPNSHYSNMYLGYIISQINPKYITGDMVIHVGGVIMIMNSCILNYRYIEIAEILLKLKVVLNTNQFILKIGDSYQKCTYYHKMLHPFITCN